MRVINFQTLELEEYDGRHVPPYAILSHTWDKEEVTFADWNTDDHGAHLAGFSKIRGFISTAREMFDSSHGWVDTCCIDKSSSAELTEAINSMYGYYSHATVCIVHLADVDDLDANSSSDIEAAVCQAKWLSRGWTLQELIAPHRVEFFGRSWRHIGSLAGQLLSRLATETGIPDRVLAYPYCSSEWSIAQRMSWASKRRTTRVEDEAYSMLGIFDVSLPLIYGEGRRAFMRLQEEIIQRSADHSIFAWDRHLRTKLTLDSCEQMFAESPADFDNAEISECYQGVPGWVEPFEMTNLGVRMSIPLIPCGDLSGTYHGVLNCRFRSCDKGPIALNLQQMSRSSDSADAKSLLTLMVMPREMGRPRQSFERRRPCTSQHFNRVSVVDEEDLLSVQQRDVLVLRRKPYVSHLGLRIWINPADPELNAYALASARATGRIKMIVNDDRSRGTRRRWALPKGDWDQLSDIWFARDRIGAITFASTMNGSSFTVILSRGDKALKIAVVEDMEQQICADLLSRRRILKPHLQILQPDAPIQFRGEHCDVTVALEQHYKMQKVLKLGVITVRSPSPNPPGGRSPFESTMQSTPRLYLPMPKLKDLDIGGLLGHVSVVEPWKSDAVEGSSRNSNGLGK